MNVVRACCRARVWSVLFVVVAAWPAAAFASATMPAVQPNDNRQAAGSLAGRTLTVALRAGAGRWRPEGSAGPALEIEALGEVGKALTVPSPLIRVTAGTTVAVSIQNDLPAALVVHGLCPRDGSPCQPLEVPAGEKRDVRFASGPAGTYHYWASAMRRAGAVSRAGRRDRRGRSEQKPVDPDRILRDHRVDEPDAAATREPSCRRTTRPKRSWRRDRAHVRHQRAVVAGDRAADLSARRACAMARASTSARRPIRCTCTGSTSTSTAWATASRDTVVRCRRIATAW